jgi:hypothetical protein
MNAAKEDNVQQVLASKGVTDFHEHFFFNKKYRYNREQMLPKEPDEASANLLAVLDFLESTEGFKDYVTPELKKHILSWAKRCQEDKYADLPDVEMFRHNGIDSDGIDWWLHDRGSRAENFHQKMITAMGPFGIGVELGHYLHVILPYFYLIGIARLWSLHASPRR